MEGEPVEPSSSLPAPVSGRPPGYLRQPDGWPHIAVAGIAFLIGLLVLFQWTLEPAFVRPPGVSSTDYLSPNPPALNPAKAWYFTAAQACFAFSAMCWTIGQITKAIWFIGRERE